MVCENLRSISLVVVNYNAGAFLEKCVSSALPHVDELIVVDNASGDGSLAAVTAFHANQSGLTIIRNEANVGFSAACNIGWHHASGNHVLFLNPDCELTPEALERMVAVLESDPSIGMVGGLLMHSGGSEQAGGRRAVPTPWRSLVRGFGLHRLAHRWPRLFFDFHLHKQPLPDSPIEVEAISGACMLVKRDAVAEVGLWDEGYFLHCEDLDWCMRFRQDGWKIVFVPNARIYHALGACSQSRRLFVEWHKHKGMIRFYRKFFRHQYSGLLVPLVSVGVWLRFGLVASWLLVQRMKRGLVRD